MLQKQFIKSIIKPTVIWILTGLIVAAVGCNFSEIKDKIHDLIHFRPSCFTVVNESEAFTGDYYYIEGGYIKYYYTLNVNSDGTVIKTDESYSKEPLISNYVLATADDNYYLVNNDYLESNKLTPGGQDIYGLKKTNSGLELYNKDFSSIIDSYLIGTPSSDTSKNSNSSGSSSGSSNNYSQGRYSYNSEEDFGNAVQNYMDDYFANNPDIDPGYDW